MWNNKEVKKMVEEMTGRRVSNIKMVLVEKSIGKKIITYSYNDGLYSRHGELRIDL